MFDVYNQGADTLEEIERIIRNYYQDLEEIDWLSKKRLRLEKRRQRIEQDISESKVYLEVEYSASNCSQERISGGEIVRSNIERSIDKAFEKLERELKMVSEEILSINIDIRSLEDKNANIEHIINSLSESSRRFVELRYGKNSSFKNIKYALNISESTLMRLRKNILQEMTVK